MKKQFTYSFGSIEQFASDNNFDIIEHGSFNVGEQFIVLKSNEKDIVVSFMLESFTPNGGQYVCVYSDLN